MASSTGTQTSYQYSDNLSGIDCSLDGWWGEFGYQADPFMPIGEIRLMIGDRVETYDVTSWTWTTSWTYGDQAVRIEAIARPTIRDVYISFTLNLDYDPVGVGVTDETVALTKNYGVKDEMAADRKTIRLRYEGEVRHLFVGDGYGDGYPWIPSPDEMIDNDNPCSQLVPSARKDMVHKPQPRYGWWG